MNEQTSAFTRRSFLIGSGSIATLGVLALAGCATPTTAGAGSTIGAGGTSVKTLNFYNNVLGDAAQKGAWQSMVGGFQKKSSATIKPVIYPSDQAATQLALLARSGQLQGVGQAGPWQILTPFDLLADLSDLAAGLDIPKGILDTYTLDGKLYALPTTAGGIGMVANGDIATSAGLKAGLTTDEFASVLETIKKQDPDLIPYAAVTKTDLKDIVPWMWGFGSEVVDDKLTATIGDAGSVAAVTWYKGLLDQGLTSANVARADARVLFAKGKTALYDDAPIAGTFVVTNGGTQSLVDNLTTISRPTDGTNASYNRSWGGGLFATAGKGEKTSREFIKYIASDVDSATVLFKQSSLAPASRKVAEKIPELQSNKFQTSFRTNVTDHARATAYDKISVAAQVDSTIALGIATILAGQTGVQAGLNTLRGQVQQLLDANK
jgi:ABC-type glycerol-3-phosphate transport system substrate-binding protein